jgi:hypothetical protein
VIPDDKHLRPIGAPPFRDADGCALFPGGHSWTSDPEWLGADGRTLHVPLRLGVVGQFELAWDCHVLESGHEIEDEEELLEDLCADPTIRELAQEQLDLLPSEGGEIAFEADEAPRGRPNEPPLEAFA